MNDTLKNISDGAKSVLAALTQTNDGLLAYTFEEFGGISHFAKELKRLGLVTIDHGSEDVVISFTTEGNAWITSQPAAL